jgi:hypothetical protein
MKVGPYAGRKVSEVKPIIREELIAAGQALPYSEPEKQVRDCAHKHYLCCVRMLLVLVGR